MQIATLAEPPHDDDVSAPGGSRVHGDAHYRVLFFIGAALFVITFLLNLAGQTYVGRLKKKLRG